MNLETHSLKLAQFQDGKWKMKDSNNILVSKFLSTLLNTYSIDEINFYYNMNIYILYYIYIYIYYKQ